jgi:hypothetical protein
MVCYRQSIRGGLTKHINPGILQRGTPDMDGVPGVTQVRTTTFYHPSSTEDSRH